LVALSCFLIAVIVVIAAMPATRYPVLAWIRQERLVNDRPVAYWLGELNDSDPKVRRQAALSLGDSRACDEDARKAKDNPECQKIAIALARTLGDGDGFVRKCAATSFLLSPREVRLPQETASAGRLTTELRDPEVAVRKAAARALWQLEPPLKDASNITALGDALRDKNDFVQAYAARALGRLGPDAKSAAPALLDRLRHDDDPEIRTLSAKALGLMGPVALGPLLPEAVAGLIEGLKNDYVEFREYAARALGQLGAKDAVNALRLSAKDSDEGVRAAAAEALKRIQATPPPP
jgi:HEAT repeat protein